MNNGTATAYQYSDDQTQTMLLIADLIVTSFIAVITAMRFRLVCGKNVRCSCKPKDAAYSPGSDAAASEVVVSPPQPQMPKNAIAVVISDK